MTILWILNGIFKTFTINAGNPQYQHCNFMHSESWWLNDLFVIYINILKLQSSSHVLTIHEWEDRMNERECRPSVIIFDLSRRISILPSRVAGRTYSFTSDMVTVAARTAGLSINWMLSFQIQKYITAQIQLKIPMTTKIFDIVPEWTDFIRQWTKIVLYGRSPPYLHTNRYINSTFIKWTSFKPCVGCSVVLEWNPNASYY